MAGRNLAEELVAFASALPDQSMVDNHLADDMENEMTSGDPQLEHAAVHVQFRYEHDVMEEHEKALGEVQRYARLAMVEAGS